MDNSQQLLDDVLSQQRANQFPNKSDPEYFEIFCAEQILKDYKLSFEELDSGIVDGEHDGGIDSVFAFVNGDLVYEDFDCSPFKKDVSIELHIIQTKTSKGFSEDVVNRLISSTKNLMKLDSDYTKLGQYSDAVKEKLDGFRRVNRELASKFPKLSIHYYYATKHANASIHKNLNHKAEELKSLAKSLFTGACVNFNFIGAIELLEMARRQPKTTHQLRASKYLSDSDGYILLCPLNEYANFLKDNDGRIKSEIFESNVRDFLGNTEVNKEIASTLKNEDIVDFWWMNNGVTILVSRASLNGDIITIENPQIVNGQQTSTQIAQNIESENDEDRSIMIKLISSEDEETRDKIIKATNSQTRILPATLRATDKVQRDIEVNLRSIGLFYDRRKNFYKNQGKPASKIISISLLAQSVMTILLGRPDSARARPSTLIKDDKDYSEVFSEEFPIDLYKNSALLVRKVDDVLRGRSELSKSDRSNIRFYTLYWVAIESMRKLNPTASNIAKLEIDSIDDGDIEAAIDRVWDLYVKLGQNDTVAKGKEFLKNVSTHVQKSFNFNKN